MDDVFVVSLAELFDIRAPASHSVSIPVARVASIERPSNSNVTYELDYVAIHSHSIATDSED